MRVMPKEMQSALTCANFSLWISVLLLCHGLSQNAYAQDWLIHRGSPALTGYLPLQVSVPKSLAWRFNVAKGQISSPVAKDKQAYVGSVKGDVFKIDTSTGKQVWQQHIELASFAAAPTLIGDLLILTSERGSIYALRQADGVQAWSFKTSGKFIGSANSYVRKDGTVCVVAVSWDNHVYVLRADSGEQVWSFAVQNRLNATPAVVDSNIIFGGCDGYVRVLDAETGLELASINAGSYIAAAVAVKWPRVYVGHHEGKLLCVEPFNDATVWTYAKREDPFVSAPTLTENCIVIGSDDQRVHAVDLAGTFLWEFETNGKVMSSALILGDKVFIGSDDGFFYVLSRKDGSLLWKYEIGAEVDSDPAYIDGLVMVSARDGHVYAFPVDILE